MTRDQIAEAQKLTRAWAPKRERLAPIPKRERLAPPANPRTEQSVTGTAKP